MTIPTQATAVQTNANPFPGLRPFDANETHLFFGRDGQSDEILTSLRRNRFVAVVGTSGSGKSSLIRAGLMPLLHGGFMAQTSSSWRIALFRPGSDPIGNMAQALNRPDVLQTDTGDIETNTLITETTLRRSGLGLIETVRQARMLDKTNLLIVVDQFEELFRFKDTGTSESAGDDAAFVKLLIEATAQTELPIYVVITMRSDFIGDCARFRELPETINRGLYLIPLMTRDQRREAITGPAAVVGTEIAPRLINRVLNDAGESPEHLPLLQHALMRTWEDWKSGQKGAGQIDLESYETIGGMEDALSRHADEAFDQLPTKRSQEIAEKVFKALAEKGPDNREVRRPTKVTELAAIADASEAEVIAVIEAFRQSGRSFLMPPPEVKLNSQSLIDISHESLIRGWRRLRDWVESETVSAVIYRRLADTAVLYEKGEAGLWQDPDLQVALGWQSKVDPNEAWGRRYHPGFPAAMNFLAESVATRDKALLEKARAKDLLQKEAQRVKELRRVRIFATVLAVALIMASALGVWAMTQTRRANQEAENAKQERLNALVAKNDADHARLEAVKAKENAEKKRQEAEENKRIADQKTEEAKANLIIANEAERRAAESARRAEAASQEARRQAEIVKAKNELIHDAIGWAQVQSQNDAGIIYDLADELIKLSSPREAVKWRTIKAEALTNMGRHQDAEDELTLALDVEKDNVDVLMTRGYMYMLTGKAKESIDDFDRILKTDPTSSLAFLNKAISQALVKDYDGASQSTHKAIETFMPGTYPSLAENEVSPQIQEATGYRKITADENSFQTALQYELTNIQAFRGGQDFVSMVKSAKRGSKSAYLTAINWAWTHMNLRTEDYGGWVSQGAMWEGLGPGYCSEAAYAYAQFQKNHRERHDSRYGSLAGWANQRAAELPCNVSGPTGAKDNAETLASRTELLIKAEDWFEAEKLLTKALDGEKDNLGLLLKRAEVFNMLHKFPESDADAARVNSLAGRPVPKALILQALASSDRGVTEDKLRAVLSQNKTNWEALDLLISRLEEKGSGEALAPNEEKRKSREQAISFIDSANKIRPYDDTLYFRKAKLQIENEDYKGALKSIEAAIGIKRDDLDYYALRLDIEKHLNVNSEELIRKLAAGYDETADQMLKRGDTGSALNTYVKSLKLLAIISKDQGSNNVQCDMALTIHKIATLIEQQGAPRDKIIAHLKFMFGDVKELEDMLNDEVRRLARSP